MAYSENIERETDEVTSPRENLPASDKISHGETQAQEEIAPYGGRGKGKVILLMIALCMAVFLAALDTVIIATALPTIAKNFKASDSGFAWIGSAYLLASAASVPFWGKTSDIFGRKPILL